MKKLFTTLLTVVLLSTAFASNAKMLTLYNFNTAEYDKVNTKSNYTADQARNYLPPIDEIHQLYDKMIGEGMQPISAMGHSLRVLNNAINQVKKNALAKKAEQTPIKAQ
ncbi:hypothetical protein [Vibrio owensii]|uniref:hypothetical protein n=1 Tax=Vibrio harveyi group TaxID=717610 RepID=UPI003CC5E936